MESGGINKGTLAAPHIFKTETIFEITEIDESIIKKEPMIVSSDNRKTCSEVYFDSIEENGLKYVCTTCNDSQSSVDEMFRHINENKDTCGNIYFKDYEKLFIAKKKFGEVFIKENYETEFLCIICNTILQNKNLIFTHLTQHLNDYKKTKIEKDDLSTTGGILPFRKKFIDIYLAENPNHNFLYACTSCDYKHMNFQSMYNHLEQKRQTCGNFDVHIKIETDRDDSFEKTLVKVCEVYMDTERKASFMCLCCKKHYSEMKSVSEHLLVQLNSKRLAESTKTSDSGLKIIAAQSLAPSFEEVINSIKLEFQETEKSEKPLKPKYKYIRDHYECKICDKKLCTIYYLRDHLKTAHSILFTQNVHRLPNLSQEELMKFKKGKDKRKSVDISYEGSLGDSESNPTKLLEFCTRPFPDLLLKTLPDLAIEASNHLKETSRRTSKTNKKSKDVSPIKSRSEDNLEKVTPDIKILKKQIVEIRNIMGNTIKSPPKSDTPNIKINGSAPIPKKEILPSKNVIVEENSKNKDINIKEVQPKSKSKYKCNVCYKILCNRYYLQDHLWRRHKIKESMLNIKRYSTENDNNNLIELSSDSSLGDINDTSEHSSIIFAGSENYDDSVFVKSNNTNDEMDSERYENLFVEEEDLEPHPKHEDIKVINLTDEANCLDIVGKGSKLKFQCKFCLQLFTNKGFSLNHLKRAHSYKYVESSIVSNDESASTAKVKAHVCNLCGKRFYLKGHLKVHMDFHNGNKRFACPEENCDRKFVIRPDLNDHIRKYHTGERPFRCQECGKCFLTSSVFYQHRLIHNNDRRYACNFCDKKFFRSSGLQNHKLIHTGEKPHACKYCSSSFRQKGDLKKHTAAVHKIEFSKN